MAEPSAEASLDPTREAVTSTLAKTSLPVSPLGAPARLSPWRPSDPLSPTSRHLAISGWGRAKVWQLESRKDKTKNPLSAERCNERRPPGVAGTARASARKHRGAELRLGEGPGALSPGLGVRPGELPVAAPATPAEKRPQRRGQPRQSPGGRGRFSPRGHGPLGRKKGAEAAASAARKFVPPSF